MLIVGAGSAGCVLAAKLSADRRRSVVLVEAGPEFAVSDTPAILRNDYGKAAVDTAFNWSYPGRMTRRQEVMMLSRGKLVGGSGAINGAMFLPGLPEDYEKWGMPGWGAAEMRLAYDRLLAGGSAEPGIDGPRETRVTLPDRSTWLPFHTAFREAALAAGFPEKPNIGDPSGSGIGAVPLNSVDGIRQPASVTHLEPVRSRPNLTVLSETRVLRLVLDGRRVTGIEAERRGRIETLPAGEVVVCASAVGSAHLLLVSGIGPAGELHEHGVTPVLDLPGVGRNLKDHPVAVVECAPRAPRLPLRTDPRFQALLQYTSPGCPDRNDMHLIPNGVAPSDGDPMAANLVQEEAWRVTICMQVVRGSGRLRISSGAPTDKPFLDYRYLEDPDDLARMREAVKLTARLLRHEAVDSVITGRLRPTDGELRDDEALDEWLFERIASAQHSSGTCRMGPSGDPHAVVDEQCRVRGVHGLRIVDLSISPDIVRAPTNATAMAIAERAGELMLRPAG